MATASENLDAINNLLQAGDVQGASDLIKQQAAQAKAEERAAAGIPPEPEPPRDPRVILMDFMRAMAMRFGHHRELVKLIDEMDRAVKAESGDAEDHKPAE